MKTTTRDNILYLAIALSIVGILGLVAWYQDAHGLPIRMPISPRQFSPVATTVVVFGYAIQVWRRAWRKPRFWIVLALLFVACVPLQWLLFGDIKTNIFTVQVVGIVELFALLTILEALLPVEYRETK